MTFSVLENKRVITVFELNVQDSKFSSFNTKVTACNWYTTEVVLAAQKLFYRNENGKTILWFPVFNYTVCQLGFI
jgi:hypothetical protein